MVNQRLRLRARHRWPGATLLILLLAGCARVAVEGGDKPIHIVMDVNVRVARELDNFFAYEEQQRPTTTAASRPAQADASGALRVDQ